MISVSCFRVRGFAQPLILCATVEGVRAGMMPDFLLVTDDGPVIVDVRRWAQRQWPTLGGCLLITPDPTIVQWGEIIASWQWAQTLQRSLPPICSAF
jgi:hypothetical protein